MGHLRVGLWPGQVAAAMAVWFGVVPALVSGQTSGITSQTVEQLAERASSGQWDTFSAQLTISRELQDADGHRVWPASQDTLVWERTKTATGWRTTTRVLSQSRPTVQSRAGAVTLAEASSIARVEDQEDGSAPRFFNRAGVELVLPSEVVRNRFRRPDAPGIDAAVADPALWTGTSARHALGREWVRSMVMSAADRSRRLRAFDRTLGRRTGVVRGFGRYLQDNRDGRREVLVDEQAAVPVEMNIVQNGTPVSHTRFSYERGVSGAIVRRGVRVEHFRPGQRLVSEVTYGDIRLQQTGGR